jgi:hypothetical protein
VEIVKGELHRRLKPRLSKRRICVNVCNPATDQTAFACWRPCASATIHFPAMEFADNRPLA